MNVWVAHLRSQANRVYIELTKIYAVRWVSIYFDLFSKQALWRLFTWINWMGMRMKTFVSLQMETFLKVFYFVRALLLLKFSIRMKLITNATSSSSSSWSGHASEDSKIQAKRTRQVKYWTIDAMWYVHIKSVLGILYTFLYVTDCECSVHGFALVYVLLSLSFSLCLCVQSKTNFLVEKKLGETEEMARMYLNHYLCSFWAIHSIFFTIQSLCDLSVLNSMSWYSLLAFLVHSKRNKNIPRSFHLFLALCICLCVLARFILSLSSQPIMYLGMEKNAWKRWFWFCFFFL